MNSFRLRAIATGVVVVAVAAAAAIATASPAFATTIDPSKTFSATGAVQTWTVPDGVTQISVDLAGGQGGASYTGGGPGAELTGTLTVTPGEKLNIVVGGRGGDGVAYSTGAGAGGGSFIYTTADQSGILVAAGGGGGAGSSAGASAASTITSGTAGGGGGGAGGTDGNGGQSDSAGGGGGLLTNSVNGGAKALANGAAGGLGSGGGAGGFGGGGGGAGTNGAGGGGGGYSGGGGGHASGALGFGGGGGGSYFAGSLSAALTNHGGDGFVTISYPAAVTSISPATGLIGDSMTISGVDLAGATVTIGGVAAAVTSSSDAQLVVTVPARTPLPSGTLAVDVSTTGGATISVPGAFSYVPAPTIDALSPAAVYVENPATVIITGNHFTGATAVNFGATPSTSFTVVSDSMITAVPPNTFPGVVHTTVVTPDGTSAPSLADQLTEFAPLISLSPVTLPSARKDVAYSSQITADGGASPYTYWIASGALPDGITLDAATGAVAGTPTVDGDFTFTVAATDGYGYVGSVHESLYVAPPIPTITAVTPTGGNVYGGTTVSINGTGFTGAITVQFGSNIAASYTVNSDTSITAVTPASSIGTVDVTVTTAGGTSSTSSADQYTFNEPKITISPSTLTQGKQGVAYSQPLVASGDSGGTYAFTLATGALPDGLDLASDGTISGTPTESGHFDFSITATSWDAFTGTAVYTLDIASSAPTITGISPATGENGQSVTITGTDLDGATVTIDGQTASPDPSATNTARSLTVVVPTLSAVAPGTLVDVKVTNPWGSATATDAFTYLSATPPSLILTPQFTTGDAVDGATVSIGAVGFAAGEPVSAVVHSTPTTIYSAVIDGTGELDATVALPKLPQGAHELVVTAGAVEKDIWFIVNGAGIITAVSMSGPVADQSGGLAFTGTDVVGPLLVAGGLLFAGLIALALVGRRRRDAR